MIYTFKMRIIISNYTSKFVKLVFQQNISSTFHQKINIK